MRQSYPRLRRIHFKDGRAPIEVFAPGKEKGEDWARQTIENVLREHLAAGHQIAGLAIVVWSPGCNVTTSDLTVTAASLLPALVIPEMVRACLQRRLTGNQIRDKIREEFGYAPQDA